MKRALITGASGFLGRHVITELTRQGVEVTTVGRVTDSTPNHYGIGNAPWHAPVLAEIVSSEQPDAIFHLVGTSIGLAQELDEVNWGTANTLMQAIRFSNIKPLLICCGSAAEYGSAIVDGVPIAENIECIPATPYGSSKLAQTRSAMAFSLATGIPVIVARIFNPFGAGLPKHLALGDFAYQIATASGPDAILNCGNLDVYRDYIDIKHVASTLCRMANNPNARGIINICSGQAVAMRELLNMLIAVSGKSIQPETDCSRVRPGELKTIIGSTTLLEQLGLMPPPTDYAKAIAELWNDTTEQCQAVPLA